MSSESPVQDTQRAVEINMNTTDAAAAEIAIGSAYTVRKNPFALIFSVLMIASIKPSTIERITRITEISVLSPNC